MGLLWFRHYQAFHSVGRRDSSALEYVAKYLRWKRLRSTPYLYILSVILRRLVVLRQHHSSRVL
jgi:hypothetical protein